MSPCGVLSTFRSRSLLSRGFPQSWGPGDPYSQPSGWKDRFSLTAYAAMRFFKEEKGTVVGSPHSRPWGGVASSSSQEGFWGAFPHCVVGLPEWSHTGDSWERKQIPPHRFTQAPPHPPGSTDKLSSVYPEALKV